MCQYKLKVLSSGDVSPVEKIVGYHPRIDEFDGVRPNANHQLLDSAGEIIEIALRGGSTVEDL